MYKLINPQTCRDIELFNEFNPWMNVIASYYYNEQLIPKLDVEIKNPLHAEFSQAGNVLKAQLQSRFGIKDDDVIKNISEKIRKAAELRAQKLFEAMDERIDGKLDESNLAKRVMRFAPLSAVER